MNGFDDTGCIYVQRYLNEILEPEGYQATVGFTYSGGVWRDGGGTYGHKVGETTKCVARLFKLNKPLAKKKWGLFGK